VADTFGTLYDPTGGKDGYDILEVNPHLAYNTNGTLVKVHRLWAAKGDIAWATKAVLQISAR
jgi:hypothetical protein